MFERWFTRLERVQVATTPREREAIYRFRYSVYVDELRREVGGVDHAARTVRDATDESPAAVHFYAGTVRDVKGSARTLIYEPGEVPEALAEELSLDLFPNIAELRIAEAGRYMIRPSLRGKLVLPSLARFGYDHVVGERKVDLIFLTCRPPLVRYYRRLGARPFGGRLFQGPDGVEIPMVSVVSDREYFYAVGAINTPQIKKYFGPGRRPPVDTRPFEHLFEADDHYVTLNARLALEQMEQRVSESAGESAVLAALPDHAMDTLASAGLVLDVPAGDAVVEQGRREQEVYLVLDGAFEVVRDGRVIATLGRGDVFGEIAFFRETGVRSATVRALTQAKVVALRRDFLEKLNRKDPDAAFTLLFNLGRVLSERLVDAGR
jgi:CRP-like cAMP-binding protein